MPFDRTVVGLMSPTDQEKKIYAFEAPTADMARIQKLAEDRKLSFSQIVRDALVGVVDPPYSGINDPRRYFPQKDLMVKRVSHAISGAVPGDYQTVIKPGGYCFIYWTVDGRTLSGCRLYQKSYGVMRATHISKQFRDTHSGVNRAIRLPKSAGFNEFDHQEITFHYSEAHRLAPLIVGVFSKTLKPFNTDLRIDRSKGWDGGLYTHLALEVLDTETALWKASIK